MLRRKCWQRNCKQSKHSDVQLVFVLTKRVPLLWIKWSRLISCTLVKFLRPITNKKNLKISNSNTILQILPSEHFINALLCAQWQCLTLLLLKRNRNESSKTNIWTINKSKKNYMNFWHNGSKKLKKCYGCKCLQLVMHLKQLWSNFSSLSKILNSQEVASQSLRTKKTAMFVFYSVQSTNSHIRSIATLLKTQTFACSPKEHPKRYGKCALTFLLMEKQYQKTIIGRRYSKKVTNTLETEVSVCSVSPSCIYPAATAKNTITLLTKW